MIKKIVTLFVCSGFFTSAWAEIQDYPFEQVGENTWVLHGPREIPNPENKGFMNNPAWVITAKGVVVIDPGSSVQVGEMVLRVIKKVTDKPVIAVFNTHIHGDHWLANDAIIRHYPEVKIYAHPEMIKQVAAGEGDRWVSLMESLTEGATQGTRVVLPNTGVDNGANIHIGKHTFIIHHFGKAHTVTDIMIEVVEEAVVFLGDNVVANRIVRMRDGSFTGNIHAIDKILQVPAKVWVPGHGATSDRSMVENYRNYLQAVYAAGKKAFDGELDSSDVKPIAIKMTQKWKDWPGYKEEIGKQSIQAYLEVEALEF